MYMLYFSCTYTITYRYIPLLSYVMPFDHNWYSSPNLVIYYRTVWKPILSSSVAHGTAFKHAQVLVWISVWKIVRGRKSKPFSGIFKIHVLHMIASIWLQIWKLKANCDHDDIIRDITAWLWILPSVFMFKRWWLQGQVLRPISWGSNVNITTVFLGYSYLKNILRNKTSQDSRSKVKVTGSPDDNPDDPDT